MELTAANEWVIYNIYRVLGDSTESFAELGLGFWQLTGANANFSELEEMSRQGPGRVKDQGGPSRFPHINRFFCMGDFAT